ncbi:hypothetical protein [Pseudomonas citronellolis]|jgi:hypothetical protein|uniref:hypothetical protein n=1 Tax=Pseudomonas citronellolis TaxID=53408 RepID=UPI0038998F74
MIQLGKKARDKITGFEGIVTGRAQYLTGCDQYSLAPPAKDGSINRTEWFDEGRLEVIGDGIAPETVAGPRPGGPQREAPNH